MSDSKAAAETATRKAPAMKLSGGEQASLEQKLPSIQVANEKYIREQKLGELMSKFMQKALKEQPEDTKAFAVDFFVNGKQD